MKLTLSKGNDESKEYAYTDCNPDTRLHGLAIKVCSVLGVVSRKQEQQNERSYGEASRGAAARAPIFNSSRHPKSGRKHCKRMSTCANARVRRSGNAFVRGDVAAKGVGCGQNGKKKKAGTHNVRRIIFYSRMRIDAVVYTSMS